MKVVFKNGFSFLILLFVCTFTNAQKIDTLNYSNGLLYFKGTFKQGLAKAQREGKMVFVDAYTSWCGPCKTLKNTILTDPALGRYMNKHFVNMAINVEKGEGRAFRRKYPHYTFPTMLYIKNNGKLKNRYVGLPDRGAQELLNFAKVVINY